MTLRRSLSSIPSARAAAARQRGFTIIEAAVALGVFAILLVSVLSIAVETSSFIGQSEIVTTVQAEANRAQARLAEVLRKSGWSVQGSIEYPRVLAAGAEIEFRMLSDLDGNGFAYDATTGDPEWGAPVFRVQRDPATETLAVYSGTTLVLTLGRHVQAVQFATYKEDSTLHMREIQISLVTSRTDRDGSPIGFTSIHSVHMRN